VEQLSSSRITRLSALLVMIYMTALSVLRMRQENDWLISYSHSCYKITSVDTILLHLKKE